MWTSRHSRCERKRLLLLSCVLRRASSIRGPSRIPKPPARTQALQHAGATQVLTWSSYVLENIIFLSGWRGSCEERSVCRETWLCFHARLHARRPRRSFINRRPCRSLYWEEKQRVEPVGIISFSRDDFSAQHQKLSFWGFRVVEEEKTSDKTDGWWIDGFRPLPRRTTGDAHQVLHDVWRVPESYFVTHTFTIAVTCSVLHIFLVTQGKKWR